VERVRVRGPAESLRGAGRLAQREASSAFRRWQLARRPPRVDAAELEAALEGDARDLLRGRVLRALPTVARWEDALGSLDADARAELLVRADALLAHRFDLLGSGPVDVGPIDWQLDFKSGRRWPLVHRSRIRISYPDGSDIKVPWELSRSQHLPLLAAAWRVTGDRRYRDEVGAQLESWVAANPVELGVNWAIAMEPAIRAVNWLATLVLLADDCADEAWFRGTLSSLLQHGRFVRGHLEGGPVRGNHYLSNVVGLLALSALFAGPEGDGWLRWGSAALDDELRHQVLADGVDHEMSTSYHRFVAEMVVVGTLVVEALAPDAVPSDRRRRIGEMLVFTRDVTRGDGLASVVGDADDGRFLPLGDHGADPRSHVHLFAQAAVPYEPAGAPAAYRSAGFYVMRSHDLYVLVRCGPTGTAGQGWHAHNDQLSLELAFGPQPLVVDPGTYVYTADPDARNLFRSTAFHATVAVDGAEQNALSRTELFRLPDGTRARCLAWEPAGDPIVFEGEHQGFRSLGEVRHRRRVELDGPGRSVRLVDTLGGVSGRELIWTFPLAGGQALADARGATATIGGVELRFDCAELAWSVEPGFYSPRYGVKVAVPFVRGRRRADGATVETALTLRVRP
jgi:hypothetical protein